MDARMKAGLIRLSRMVCAGFALGGPALVAAQSGLADPTRPPNAPSASAANEPAPAGLRLQSILIAPGRRIAVIDGHTVAQGGKLGDATVSRIDASSVTLLVGDERKVLQLLPDAARKTVRERAKGAGKDR